MDTPVATVGDNPPVKAHAGHSGDMTVMLQMLLDLTKRRAESLRKTQLVKSKNHGLTSGEVKSCRAYAESISKSLEPLAETYSRAWNRGFAANIIQYLPRELRDMINKELLNLYFPGNEGNEVIPNCSVYTQRIAHCGPVTIDNYPHSFDHTFMGSQFITELSTVYHSHRCFDLQSPIELKGFLELDRFGSKCVPSKHVRSIVIGVSLDSFNLDSRSFRAWSSPKYKVPMRSHYLKALQALSELKSVRNKRGSKITIRADRKTKDAGPKFEEALVPYVYDLKDSGWIVHVESAESGYHAYTWSGAAYLFNYDITRAEWETKIRTSSAFSKDDEAAAMRPNFLARMQGE